MASLKSKCPTCGKDAKMKYETPFGSKVLRAFTCGHTVFTDIEVSPEASLEEVDAFLSTLNTKIDDELGRFDDDGGVLSYSSVDKSFFSLDGSKRAYEFQIEGVHFIEHTNFNCLVADDMGLGKTIQALVAVKRNMGKVCPVLFIVKGATTLQWCAEFREWVDSTPMAVMPIINRECIIPGFDFYVISMDFINRKGVEEALEKLNFKLVILDECQSYKNDSTGRTKSLITLIQNSKIKHRIGLSGTPIKNRAIEYFVMLNLLDPQRFYSKKAFRDSWIEGNRIAPWRLDAFREVTKRYIIRREKRDVLKNLPPMRRNYVLVEITDPAIKNLYNAELDLFSNFTKTAQKLNSTVLLGWLAKMRAITGQAKVPWALEYVQNVMDDSDESLAVGIHHHSVRDTIYFATKACGYEPLKISGEDDIFAKDRAQRAFNEGRSRLLVLNMIAGGVGLNLQKACHHFVALERMWNSADEEQFEARFDRDGQTYPVEGTYPYAAGTIDEWFHEMVMEKRKMLKETMGDASFNVEADEEFLNALVQRTLENRL